MHNAHMRRNALLGPLAVAVTLGLAGAGLGATATATTTARAPSADRYGNWLTYHRDAARTGDDPFATAASGHFTASWSTPLDGAVYGEPLAGSGRIVAVTENDSAYALNETGAILWRTHLGQPVRQSELPCGDIDPLGITSTPVYDPSSKLLFVAAELNNPIRHVLFALNPTTGAVRWSRGIDPAGSTPSVQQQRGALALASGSVWVPFGGLAGDCGNYHGYLVGVATSGAGATSVYQTQSAREAGIWAPSGPAVDGQGNLYAAVGNGAATAPPYDYSDSILKLAGNQLISYFAPTDWAQENAADQDLGSTGPGLVGSYVFADGKGGTAYLLNQADLGGIGGQAAALALCQSFGGTAYDGATVYVPCSDGIRAVGIGPGAQMSVRWHNTSTGFGSAPVIGGGAVWAVNNAQLVQIDPATGTTVATVSIGTAPSFATPTLHGPWVYVGTNAGVTGVKTS